MIFRRRHKPLAGHSDEALIAEIELRGWEVRRPGDFQAAEEALAAARVALCELALRLGERESQTLEARVASGQMVDGTAEVRQLGYFASVEFPRAVAMLGEAHTENRVLRERAVRSEAEAAMLAHALVGGEIAQLENNDELGT
jgi:hypothetical protein